MDYLFDMLKVCSRNIPIEVYYRDLDLRYIGYPKDVLEYMEDDYLDGGRPTYIFLTNIEEEGMSYGNGLYIECE